MNTNSLPTTTNTIGETQPTIHGLISRQQMYDMWAPYGDRLDVHGGLDLSSISPAEMLHVMLAGGKTMHRNISALAARDDDFLDVVGKGFDGNMEPIGQDKDPRILDSLLRSHRAQQKRVRDARAEYTEKWPGIVRKTAQAALKLIAEGVFTAQQAEQFEDWLISPDGTPRLQYVPMSRLEFVRFAFNFDHEVPEIYDESAMSNDVTEMGLGVITSAHSLYGRSNSVRSHNCIHELVHASLSGLEIYDVTRDDGLRVPQASIIGLYSQEPTTHTEQGEYSSVENAELAEGWTEYITERLIDIDPTLGASLGQTAYGRWAKVVATIKTVHPLLYQEITGAALYDAITPQDKRRKIALIHEYADKKLGAKRSLDRIFQSTGGTYGAAHGAE